MRRQKINSLARQLAPKEKAFAIRFGCDRDDEIRIFPDVGTPVPVGDKQLELWTDIWSHIGGQGPGGFIALGSLLAGCGVKYPGEYFAQGDFELFEVVDNIGT